MVRARADFPGGKFGTSRRRDAPAHDASICAYTKVLMFEGGGGIILNALLLDTITISAQESVHLDKF
jgi:hypothetical protein